MRICIDSYTKTRNFNKARGRAARGTVWVDTHIDFTEQVQTMRIYRTHVNTYLRVCPALTTRV